MSASSAGRAAAAAVRTPSMSAASGPSWGLRAAAAASVVLVALDIGVRLIVPPTVAPPVNGSASGPELPLAPLLAIAALCVVGMGLRREASLAWLAAVAADSIVAADLVDLGLVVRDHSGLTARRPRGDPVRGTDDGGRDRRRLRRIPTRRLHRAVGWLGSWPPRGWSWPVPSPSGQSSPTRCPARQSVVRVVTLPVRWWQFAALGFVGLGILGDVVAADRRARRRAVARAARTADGGSSTAWRAGWTRASRPSSMSWCRAGPRRATRRPKRSARGSPRSSMPRSCPPSGRALAAVEAGGSVERLATDLRDVLGEVEGLLAQRRSIVLEELGLVAGLEWLAERVEERGSSA